ncbi:helix-turn-helix domain-containing protein [Streptomyces sp. NPDC020965]|uniref:helix-turn-helix domain-containing protein n=1 Tax=Streptomyces sp. NPDC020965 TaxID=3365105 RepID=UPI0037AE1ADC
MDNDDLTFGDLLERGVAHLRDLLGPGWTVAPRSERAPSGVGLIIEVRPEGGNAYTELLVDAKTSVTPRLAEEVLVPKANLLRHVTGPTNLLVIAPWISPKTQELLRRHGIGYLDLTGNVSLRVTRPAIVIHTEGAPRAPRTTAPERSRTTLAGPKAGRLVRLLTDVRPPYRAMELARASGLSLGYVSRLLDSLEDQLLIRRDGREITDVDWPNLLRTRAAQDRLLRPNSYISLLAPNGVPSVLDGIRELSSALLRRLALTGSYAAHQVAPLSAGGQLMLHVAPDVDLDDLTDDLGLLPVSENADIVLLPARDRVVFERTVTMEGLPYVALSQLVLDCLSGPGRMPAEGEAVLKHMADHDRWRADGIADLRDRPRF